MTANALIEVLLPAYRPCANLAGPCLGACDWNPNRGLVPCAFGGATGGLEDVRLVIITAEPGKPPDNASYRGLPEDMVRHSIAIFERAMSGGLKRLGSPTPFHRNMRRILDCFWPDLTLEEQLRLTWTTNAVLCPAKVTGGSHLRDVEAACAQTYLAPQLALLPNAFRVALGQKARDRMRRADLRVDTFGPHPCARGSNENKLQAWQKAADLFHGAR